MKNDFVKEIKKNIYLSESDLSILKKYDIDYNNFSSMKELIFYLDNFLNSFESDDDLEELLIKLNDYNYYFYFNK